MVQAAPLGVRFLGRPPARTASPQTRALAHFPSGRFLANAASTAIAHNLVRRTTLIGLPDTIIPVARTLHRRLLTAPGRITHTARQVTLRMPARPWELAFLAALKRLRAVPVLT